MKGISWEKRGAVAVLVMEGAENRFNARSVEWLHGALDEVLADGDVQALVITSSGPKVFCLGADVAWVEARYAAGEDDVVEAFMLRMNALFRRLLAYPLPVIAAINGHAFGGGALLACACDFRFMRTDRGYFCLPGVDLGVPILPGMIAWLRKALPDALFDELYLGGTRVTAERLARDGAIRTACPDTESLLRESLAFAATFVKKRGIYGELKLRKHREILRLIDEEDPQHVATLWSEALP